VPVVVSWNQGGTATIEEIDDDRVQLSSSRAFAPGSRPEATVSLGAVTSTLWMKVHGSRLQEDGFYRVHGRLLNVTRDTRERLKEAVSAPNGGKTPPS
jgi:hypothetical protein